MLAESHVLSTDPTPELPVALLGAAFRSLPMPALIVDPDQVPASVVFANAAFFRETGYSPDEVLGRSWQDLQDPGADAASIDAALRRGEAFEVEYGGRRKDGSSFLSCLAVSPVHDEAGRLRLVTMLLNDAGAKNLALEEQIERRTRDLEAALEQRTSLLHEVEHRVKNSLQMTASLVLLKARRLQNPEARRALQEIAERVSALAAAHRLLYGSHDASWFNLKDFTSELAGELVAALPKGQVSLDLQIQPLGVPASKAAPLALLLNEVIGNAVKHAFPNGRQGRLTIGIGRIENGLRIAVEDDGVGLDHAPLPEGSFGKTLITMLVHQLKGRLTWSDQKPGTRAEIVIPVDAEETKFE